MKLYKILQRTISSSISFSGVGLHTGDLCNVTLRPCDADTGIIFIRKDLRENNMVPADYRHIYKSNLCTTLKSYNYDTKILTVEHLLAAIKGNGIDNLIIEIDSPEIPILDGPTELTFETDGEKDLSANITKSDDFNQSISSNLGRHVVRGAILSPSALRLPRDDRRDGYGRK